LYDLTCPGNPHEAGGDPAVLSNTPSLFRAGWQALENVGRVFLPNRRKARTRACEPARRLPGFDRASDRPWLIPTSSGCSRPYLQSRACDQLLRPARRGSKQELCCESLETDDRSIPPSNRRFDPSILIITQWSWARIEL